MADFLASLLEVSLALGALAALLLALTPALGRRFAPQWRCWAWLLLGLRLAVPLNFSLPQAPVALSAPAVRQDVVYAAPAPVGDAVLTQDAAGAPGGGQGTAPAPQGQIPAPAPDRASPALDAGGGEPAERAISPAAVLFWVWAAGAACFLAAQVASYARFRRLLRRWSRPAGTYGGLPVRECRAVRSPVLAGFLRPAIYLPGALAGEGRDFALLHEYAHFRRRDLWYKLLLVWANALHWFNPAVWLLRRAAERDVELACDALVLRDRDAGFRRRYGTALLATVSGRQPAGALTTNFSGGMAELRRRFRSLADAAPKRRGRAALLLVACAALLAGGLVACREPAELVEESCPVYYDGESGVIFDPESGYGVLVPEELRGRVAVRGDGGHVYLLDARGTMEPAHYLSNALLTLTPGEEPVTGAGTLAEALRPGIFAANRAYRDSEDLLAVPVGCDRQAYTLTYCPVAMWSVSAGDGGRLNEFMQAVPTAELPGRTLIYRSPYQAGAYQMLCFSAEAVTVPVSVAAAGWELVPREADGVFTYSSKASDWRTIAEASLEQPLACWMTVEDGELTYIRGGMPCDAAPQETPNILSVDDWSGIMRGLRVGGTQYGTSVEPRSINGQLFVAISGTVDGRTLTVYGEDGSQSKPLIYLPAEEVSLQGRPPAPLTEEGLEEFMLSQLLSSWAPTILKAEIDQDQRVSALDWVWGYYEDARAEEAREVQIRAVDAQAGTISFAEFVNTDAETLPLAEDALIRLLDNEGEYVYLKLEDFAHSINLRSSYGPTCKLEIGDGRIYSVAQVRMDVPADDPVVDGLWEQEGVVDVQELGGGLYVNEVAGFHLTLPDLGGESMVLVTVEGEGLALGEGVPEGGQTLAPVYTTVCVHREVLEQLTLQDVLTSRWCIFGVSVSPMGVYLNLGRKYFPDWVKSTLSDGARAAYEALADGMPQLQESIAIDRLPDGTYYAGGQISYGPMTDENPQPGGIEIRLVGVEEATGAVVDLSWRWTLPLSGDVRLIQEDGGAFDGTAVDFLEDFNAAARALSQGNRDHTRPFYGVLTLQVTVEDGAAAELRRLPPPVRD